jgi:two-component system, cell cycle response regulator DivK
MRHSILIVDDNEPNLELIEAVLDAENYLVKTAKDAEEALRVLETFEPGLILMDIQLPGMDGLELTRVLKRDPIRCHITVVALTAYAMKGDEENARAAGCDGYVTKPIDTRALPKLIASLLESGVRSVSATVTKGPTDRPELISVDSSDPPSRRS